MLSEISQDTGRQILYDITYMWNLKIKTTEYSEKVDTYIENKLVVIKQREGSGRGRDLRGSNYYSWDFPSGTVDKNPPANSRDTGSVSGLGGFHIMQGNHAHVPPPLLSPSSRTQESQLLSPNVAATEVCCTPRACALQQEKLLQ